VVAALLGIDIGTSSTKGVLCDPGGQVLATVVRPHVTSMPRPGWAEHDALTVWWADVCAVSRELLAQAGGVEVLGVCEELGIRAVELRTIDGVSIVDTTPSVLRAIRDELNVRGFRVCAIASPFLKCGRGDDPLAQERVHDRALEAAMMMSAPVVRAFAYWREAHPSAVLQELGSALNRAAARSSDAGATLALENEHECNVATSAEARAALDAADSPHLRLIWDPGNAAMLDPASFAGLGGLETIYDQVAHVHLKDVSASGSWTRIGEGIVDFAALLRYLASAGYEGYLSFETHYQRDGSGELSTRDCVAALRSIAAHADVELTA